MHPTQLPLRRVASALALALAVLTTASACQPATPTRPPVVAPPDPTTTTTSRGPASTTTTTRVPASTTTTTAVSRPADPLVVPAGYTYAGGDEFNDATLDATRWRAYHNTYGDSNAELACLTPGNLTEAGGTLEITARKQTATCPGGSTESYTSGFIGSREAGRYYPKYARFEIRARLPHAQGLWPAFWLRHRNGAGVAEVDIMEYFHSQVPGKTSQTLHLDGVSNISKKATAFEAPVATGGWHTWAVDIAPDPGGVRFTFLTDGAVTHTVVDPHHAWASSDDAATWDIAANLAVGGRWTGDPDGTLGYLDQIDRCSIGGTAPRACTTTGIRRVEWSHATYDIDYIRVFRRS
jgi:beta-glucanase (GH16 family)